MSKINAIRIVNLSYNKGNNRIDDEIYYMGSKNTFMSLRNGGGKSVLVQMISAPFVNPSYRDMPKRPFKNYFTSSSPTYILVEWDKGPNAGFILTGLMIRKNQLPESEIQKGKELDIYSFTHEYKTSNEYDLEKFPVIEQTHQGKKIKGFDVVKALFEKHSKEVSSFKMYNMADDSARRKYFNNLKENKIYKSEWESIMKDINSDESGLSNLFEKAENEYGLVSRWFLPKIRDKLNREDDRVKKFCHIVDEYITQYNNNKANIKKQENVYRFKEEATQLLEYAEKVNVTITENKAVKNKIASIILTLNNLEKQTADELDKCIRELIDERAELNEIQYEELSLKIHALKDEISAIEEDIASIDQKLLETKNQANQVSRNLHIQECSKLFEELQESSKRVLQRENELEITRKKSEDLEPERLDIGYSIKCHYEDERSRLQELYNKSIEELQSKKEEVKSLENQAESLNYLKNELSQKEGSLNSEIAGFTSVQNAFNERFDEMLARNILGEFPEGSLDAKRESIDEEIESIEKELRAATQLQEQNLEKFNTLQRELTATSDVLNEYKSLEKEKVEELLEFDNYLKERRHLMKYIELDNTDVFETEKIVLGTQKEIARLKLVEKNTQIEQSGYDLELTKLQRGKLCDIPKEVSDELGKKDIQYSYGMDWLKNNNKSLQENKKVIENNPFVPYSIILSSGELERLKRDALDVYTSVPVPIIQREKLEVMAKSPLNGLLELDNISFYVFFNTNLLDHEELQRLKDDLSIKIDNLQEKIDEVGSTIAKLQGLLDRVQRQNFSKNLYNNCNRDLDKVKMDIANTKEKIDDLQDEKSELDNKRFSFQDQINNLKSKLKDEEDKLKSFELLVGKYEQYKEHRLLREGLLGKIKETEDLLVEVTKRTKKLRESVENETEIKLGYAQSIKSVNRKLNTYGVFKTGSRVIKDIVDLESRFDAISTQTAMEEETLECLLREANEDYSKKEAELSEKQDEYNLNEPEFREVPYDKFKEISLKERINTCLDEIEALNKSNQSAFVKKARKEEMLNQTYTKLLDDENLPNEPKSLVCIIALNFEERKQKTVRNISQLSKQKERVNRKLELLINSLAALENFAEYEVESYVEIEISLSEVKELRTALIKEVSESEKLINNSIKELQKVLDDVLRIPEFEDPFFKIPLENLVETVNNPEIFIQQLNTVLNSYEQILEMLRVNLELVTSEKDKILQVLLQYVRDVHSEMGKIDNNSSIKIRNRYVKMLDIKLPNWEENEDYYEVRLKNLLERLTEKSLEALGENEPIKDIVSQTINIESLYNQVVGIGNVIITLYKIEAEREQVVSWNEVAANSGGEGFLSAFVVLSSLLNLMRRDDTDIFAERNEGKVLMMDNPFAKANAVHLLKPLIEIANKSNTQLICFSGLGGDSILNRFDNMYILNPTKAKFKKNVEIMQSEHVKGLEYEGIVSTRIEVQDGEQVELF